MGAQQSSVALEKETKEPAPAVQSETAEKKPKPKNISDATLNNIISGIDQQLQKDNVSFSEQDLVILAEFMAYISFYFEWLTEKKGARPGSLRKLVDEANERLRNKYGKDNADTAQADSKFVPSESYRMPRYETYSMPTSMNLRY
jgi:hypothetical protein